MNSNIKRQQMDDSKNEYANQLQKTNELQSQFYNKLMPSVFNSLQANQSKGIHNLKCAQDMDEQRVKCIQTFMRKSAQTEQVYSDNLKPPAPLKSADCHVLCRTCFQ